MPSSTPDLPELLYLFDPLCGWCYGMTPVVQQIQGTLAGQLHVTILSGGMITGEDVGPIGSAWPYISQAMQQVSQVTGASFGEAFQAVGEQGQQVQDSEPPSRALAVFRQLDEREQAVNFAHAVQEALFQDGQDLNLLDTYEPLVTKLGVSWPEFLLRWELPTSRQAVQQEFAAVARLGVQGFPMCILRVGSQGYVLARGYQPYATLLDGIQQALAQAAE
ncbi:DsbA family protein [Hymenobacter lutimineralis]|uniref:DsbA family protein n=1 Tax=Hymenobacter lutimineralis TaxID=2606448 RepID=A0A5D6UUY8_9BACT|nr:DsbA family protein [Hymenobacter lutimineralis]TYZ06765.1 DsbA family protein [Hymenobacter lutimineralis]